jgi:predicted amidohydrolase YtcJ
MGVLGGRSIYDDLAAIRDDGQLGLRFLVYFRHHLLAEVVEAGLRSGDGDASLRVGGLKLFLDGTLGSLTADMLTEYDSRPGYRGLPTLEYEEYRELITRAAEAGLATAVHCIGDAANRKALDGFELLRSRRGSRELRHRIEHVQLIDRADLPRFRELGVLASMQPIHASADMAVAQEHWGDRTDRAYAWRSILDSGAALVFGSDAPIETLDVLAGIHTAVTRQDQAGTPPGGWHPEQCISLEEALAAYTEGPARAAGLSDVLGRLAPGRKADLVVLDRSPHDVAPDELIDLQVKATMIDGMWVWQAPESDLPGPRFSGD